MFLREGELTILQGNERNDDMKRVLSLLLLIPFLTVQVLAGLGGPYEDAYSYTKGAWAGTYGISLQGTEAAGLESMSTTGVMAVSIPPYGFCTARVLVFNEGLMYLGSGQGNLEPQNKHLHLITQASHYAIIDSLNQTLAPVVDYILSGQVDLNLNVDYMSGVVSVKGKAVFARYDPMAEELNVRTATLAAVNTIGGGTTALSSTNTVGTELARSQTTNQAQSQGITNDVAQSLSVKDATDTTTSTKGVSGDGTPNGTSTSSATSSTTIQPDGSSLVVSTTTTDGSVEPLLTAATTANSNEQVSSQKQTNTDTTSLNLTDLSNRQDKISNGNAQTTAQVNSTQNAIQNNATVYTNLNELHHTTPLSGSTVKGSDSITVPASSSVDLRPGMSVSGPGIRYGTTITAVNGNKVKLSKPATATASDAKLSCDPSSIIFLEMTADGIRETTEVVVLNPISAPNAGSHYQVGVVQVLPNSTTPGGAATGGTPAAGGGGGGGGAIGGGAGA